MIKYWQRRWFLRKRTFKRSLHRTPGFSLLGKRVFHPRLWKSDRRSIAGGVAIGLFTAFTPTIPFQMLLAAVGAILFKVNMPLALAACWVTNPLTAFPIYVSARNLGKMMLTHHERVEGFVLLFVPGGQTGRIIREGIYLTSGSLVFSALAAAGGYLLVLLLWKLVEKLEKGRRARRMTPPVQPAIERNSMQKRDADPERHSLLNPSVVSGKIGGIRGHGLIPVMVLAVSQLAAASPAAPAFQDVVVTARKRVESGQSVPGSMTVRTAEQIAAMAAADLRDATTGIPNVTLGIFTARRLTFPYVRGIGSGQNAPGVTTYIDGVPQLSNVTANQELLGVERLEFLRGPQSAMYGVNSLGGVINIVPRMPPDSPRRSVRLAAGSHGYHEGRLAVGGPLAGTGLLFSLEGGYAARDGYTRNRMTGSDLDGREAWAGRMQLYLPDQGDWDFRLSLTMQRDRDGGYALYDLGRIRSDPHRVNHDFEGYNHRDLAQPVFTARRQGINADFISMTAWQWWQTRDSTDLDYTPADWVRKDASEDARAWIQEWRLSSPADAPLAWGDRITLHWLAGVFAFHEEISRKDITDYRPGGVAFGMWPAPFSMQSDASQENTGASIFGHMVFSLEGRWELGLGLRYDYQHRSAETSRGIPQGPIMATSDPSRDFHQVSPRGSVGYRVTPQILVYADVAKGYRAGGVNAIAPPDWTSYDEETSINYETGLKTTWLGRRLAFNAALFHTDWEDLQVNTQVPGGSPSDYYVANAGKAWSRGAEFELRATLLPSLALFAGAGLLDTRYRSGSQSAGEDVSGNTLPFAPRLTWQAGLDYGYTLGSLRKGFVRTEVLGSSGFEYDASNRESQESYALVNLGLGMVAGPWRVTGWVRNVFDLETVPLAIPYGPDALGQPLYIGESGAPRTVGISLARAF